MNDLEFAPRLWTLLVGRPFRLLKYQIQICKLVLLPYVRPSGVDGSVK